MDKDAAIGKEKMNNYLTMLGFDSLPLARPIYKRTSFGHLDFSALHSHNATLSIRGRKKRHLLDFPSKTEVLPTSTPMIE